MTVMTRAIARLLLPASVMVAAAVLVKGYVDVGDGFSAGIVIALGVLVQFLVFGPEQARAIVIVRRAPQLAAAGLALALAVAFVPVALGDPVMTHRPAAGAKVLHLGSIEGLTAVLFDVGVFLLVLGFSVGALDLAATMRERRRP